VRHTAWRKDEPLGTKANLLLANLVDVLALEHVEEFILAFVDVCRRVEQGSGLFDQGVGTSGCL
jgi:hypothetical protein